VRQRAGTVSTDAILIFEQCLNGLQFGLMLFLLAAGLTLVFGIMDMINLAHGSLYMIGAYLAATLVPATGSFWLGVALAAGGTAVIGMLLEISVLRTLYQRDHLSQVLATFALLLIANELVRIIFGDQALLLNAPEALSGPVELLPGFTYPSYRLVIIAVGLVVAFALYALVAHTRIGMLVRAGASNREMALAMGVNVKRLFTAVFGVGAALCALAGAMLGPLLAVQVGMGESILILAFVVIVIGGIGSIRGALLGALLVGIVDTAGRTLLPMTLRAIMPPAIASNLGPALASILIYVLMVAVLFWRPQGLFPARG
jgi:branched-chain amino acid transport system permease protein